MISRTIGPSEGSWPPTIFACNEGEGGGGGGVKMRPRRLSPFFVGGGKGGRGRRSVG